MVIFYLAGCSGDITNVEREESSTKSEQKLDLKSNMKKAALLMTDLVKNPDVVRELKFAADYSRKELGRDEDVYFSELFNGDAPYKKAMKKAKISAVGNFASAFRNVANSTKAKGMETGVDLESYLQEHNLKVYWPYSEYWDADVTPAVSYHPIDNEDENEGFKPVASTQSAKSISGYETITMNDEYASNNPSMLIIPCEEGQVGVYESTSLEASCGGGGTGGSSVGGGSSDTIQLKEDGDTVPQIYLGYLKLNKHYDGLFAGGPEMRFAFADVVEVEPGNLTVETITLHKNFTRPDINNNRWQEKMVLADHRWHAYQKTLLLHVYDKDSNGTTQLNMTTAIEDIEGTTFELESSYKVHKERDNVGKYLLDREVFLQENKSSFPNGLKEGFHIYKKGGLELTLPHHLIDLTN